MQKSIAFIIIISITLFGCSNSNDVNENQVPTSGNITVGQDEYKMVTGKYTWEGEKTEVNSIDEYSAIEKAKEFDTLSIGKGTNIEIFIDENPKITVFEWNENGEKNEIPLEDNKITVPSRSGAYVYEVHAEWLNGEAFFVFDMEVK